MQTRLDWPIPDLMVNFYWYTSIGVLSFWNRQNMEVSRD